MCHIKPYACMQLQKALGSPLARRLDALAAPPALMLSSWRRSWSPQGIGLPWGTSTPLRTCISQSPPRAWPAASRNAAAHQRPMGHTMPAAHGRLAGERLAGSYWVPPSLPWGWPMIMSQPMSWPGGQLQAGQQCIRQGATKPWSWPVQARVLRRAWGSRRSVLMSIMSPGRRRSQFCYTTCLVEARARAGELICC